MTPLAGRTQKDGGRVMPGSSHCIGLGKVRVVALAVLVVLTGAGFAMSQSPARDPAQTAAPQTAAPQIEIMAPPAANEAALNGTVVLVDIRTPEEWTATGVPASAHAITMHQKPEVFLAEVLKAAGGDPTRTIAVICRTGSRTTALAGPLSRAGFPNVINVVEGVVGGPNGPGWQKRGLPLRAWTSGDPGPQLAVQ